MEEDRGGLGLGNLLLSPEIGEDGGGSVELRRTISPAWGHDSRGMERGNGEEREGYL